MSNHNDEEWIKKWIARIQDDPDVFIHSNGISHDSRYQQFRVELPESLRPLYDAYMHNIEKRRKSDE